MDQGVHDWMDQEMHGWLDFGICWRDVSGVGVCCDFDMVHGVGAWRFGCIGYP